MKCFFCIFPLDLEFCIKFSDLYDDGFMVVLHM